MYEARDTKIIEELQRRIDVALKILGCMPNRGEAATLRKNEGARSALQDPAEPTYDTWMAREYSDAVNALIRTPSPENANAYRDALWYYKQQGWRWANEDYKPLVRALAIAEDR